MNISERQRKILKDIAKEIVIQSPDHQDNITEYYQIIQDAVVNEFTEDNVPTTKSLLQECHQKALDTLWPDEMLGTAATARYEAEMNREPTLIEKVQQWFEDYKQEKAKPKITIMHYTDLPKKKGYEPCPLCRQPRIYNETKDTIVCIPCNGSRDATNQEIIEHYKD